MRPAVIKQRMIDFSSKYTILFYQNSYFQDLGWVQIWLIKPKTLIWKHANNSDLNFALLFIDFLNDLMDTRKCVLSPLIHFNILECPEFINFIDEDQEHSLELQTLKNE